MCSPWRGPAFFSENLGLFWWTLDPRLAVWKHSDHLLGSQPSTLAFENQEPVWIVTARPTTCPAYPGPMPLIFRLDPGIQKAEFRSSLQFMVGTSLEVQMVKSACASGDLCLIPGWGRSSGEENINPLQYSCLQNSMDRGSWWATVHGVAESRTLLRDYHFNFPFPFSVHAHCYSQSIQTPFSLVLIQFSLFFTPKDGEQAKAAGFLSKHPPCGIVGRNVWASQKEASNYSGSKNLLTN